ncbi:MAG TPA: hypothetical protein VKT75_07095 [Acidobacteriaceae bacterium]|nr:hypothetical protein [Acidobacteriaceae bacterium]
MASLEILLKRFTTLLMLAACCPSGALLAQNTAPNAPAPLPQGGLQIASVSAYAVYESSFLPTGASFQTGVNNLPYDVGFGGSIAVRWTKFSERSTFALNYTPSYVGYARNSNLNALNHSFSLTASRKIAPRWTFTFALTGNLSTTDQFLFAPTALGNVAAVSSTFNDLASGLLAGKFANNPLLGTVLTRSPLLLSPVSNLLYGQRMFTASAQTTLSYSYSPRLSLTFAGGGSRSQYLSTNQPPAGGRGSFLTDTTSGNASAGFSYSLSPFTQIGGSADSTRTASSFFDAYTTTSQLTLGRTLNRRWILQAHGGVGITTIVRTSVSAVPTEPRPIFGGSLAYKTLSHTFIGSYDRSTVDSYGLGASTTSSSNAAWRWQRPGRSWWITAGFGWQQLTGGAVENITGWQSSAGVNRAIGSHVVLQTQYAYLNYSGNPQGAPISGSPLGSAYSSSQHAVRLALTWMPQSAITR